MTKVKYFVVFLIATMFILLVPNFVNAATEYTYSDTEQGIEWIYELDESENVVNLRCKTTAKTGEVIIPSTIDGKTVLSLSDDNYGTGAFEECVGITSVKIPDTIRTIGIKAFKNCTGLKTITIPNSVTKIGDYAFQGCSGVKTLTLSENLISIGSFAFSNCSGITSVTIPNSVTTIGEEAFANCSGMKKLTISENLTKIDDATFYECSALKSVILPESVTTISGDYSWTGAFAKCVSLEKILIPDSVASIEKNAFNGCDKLTIYGNDGQTSKTYAEENEINFKYISQWDESELGDDITPPTVEKIHVTYASLLGTEFDEGIWMVPEGTNLVIEVKFSETVVGTIAPTLTIKFGVGDNIEVTEGIIAGSMAKYVYTVKNTDNGAMTAVKLTGGDVKDEAGNVATLSCPELKPELSVGDLIYANGTATESNNNGTNNNGTNNNGTNNNGTNNNGTNNNGTNNNETSNNETNNNATNNTTVSTEKDKTQATGKIPHAGIEMGIIFAIIAFVVAGAVVYSRYNKMRDIL